MRSDVSIPINIEILGIRDGTLLGRVIYPKRPAWPVLFEVRIDEDIFGRFIAKPADCVVETGHFFEIVLTNARLSDSFWVRIISFWGRQLVAINIIRNSAGVLEIGSEMRPIAQLTYVDPESELRAEGGALYVSDGQLIGWARFLDDATASVMLDVVIDGVVAAVVRTKIVNSVNDNESTELRNNIFVINLSKVENNKPMTMFNSATGEVVIENLYVDDVPKRASVALNNGPAKALVVQRPGYDDDSHSDSRLKQALAKADHAYQAWLKTYDVAAPSVVERARAFIANGVDGLPTVSVVLIARDREENIDPAAWDFTLRSLRSQIFLPQEIFCSASLSPPDGVTVLDGSSMNAIFEYSKSEFVAFITIGDQISPVALLVMAMEATNNSMGRIFYSDNDRINDVSGVRDQPYFKGPADLNLMLCQDYMTCLAMFARNVGDMPLERQPISERGLYLFVTELALRLFDAQNAIVPVPFVLYHRASSGMASRSHDFELASEINHIIDRLVSGGCLRTHAAMAPRVVARQGGRRVCWPLPTITPLVSVIIPTRDRVDLLRQCVNGLLSDTAYWPMEIIIVDNESRDAETIEYLNEVDKLHFVKVFKFNGDFDFARMNNEAAELVGGEFILLLNNDIKISNEIWLEEMVRQMSCSTVGAVGARLLYADGRIQHAGIGVGIGGVASHVYKGQPADAHGHGGRLLAIHDVTAVTAACMLVRRAAWRQVGGFSVDFPVAYNDVDLCLKLRRHSWNVVFVPFACLYHLESASRGGEDTPDKIARFAADKSRMQERWPNELQYDRFLGPNWSLKSTDAMPAVPPKTKIFW